MFAQQTSLQVFLLVPVACRRQESSIRTRLFFGKKTKKTKRIFFPSKRGSKEPLFTIEIIEIHFWAGRKFSFWKLNRRVFGIFSPDFSKRWDLIPTRPGRGSGVEGDGWKYGCGGEGVAAGRRAWPCRPRSPLQNGTFWRSSEASWGSSKGYREKSLNLTNCHFT